MRTSSSPSRTGSAGEGEPAADTRTRGFVLPLAFLAMLLGLAAVSFARTASTVVAGAAVVLSLRRDREASYMVMLSASLLVVPLLWDHYLATLVVPAAFLAQRLWRPLLLLPLLSWLPAGAPILVVATMLLLFLVERKTPGTEPVPVPA